jgi:hypothetical protein
MSKSFNKHKMFQAQKNPTTKSGVLMFGTSGRTRTGTPEETRF